MYLPYYAQPEDRLMTTYTHQQEMARMQYALDVAYDSFNRLHLLKLIENYDVLVYLMSYLRLHDREALIDALPQKRALLIKIHNTLFKEEIRINLVKHMPDRVFDWRSPDTNDCDAKGDPDMDLSNVDNPKFNPLNSHWMFS